MHANTRIRTIGGDLLNSKPKTNVRVIAKALNCLLICFVIAIIILMYTISFYESGGAEAKFIVYYIFYPLLFVGGICAWILSALSLKHPYEFFNRAENELRGAYRYESAYESCNDFVDYFRNSIIKDGFEHIGLIENASGANMEVFARSVEFNREAVVLIEADVFTEDMLFEHWPRFKQLIDDYSGYPKWDWKKRMRTVVVVSEMSVPLQILLSARNVLGRESVGFSEIVIGQVYAIVGKERKVYVKVHPDNSTKKDRTNWLEKYFVNPKGMGAEHVWKDVKWKDIEHEFPQYKDLVMAVHKALNVWKGGYQEDQGETESGSSDQ